MRSITTIHTTVERYREQRVSTRIRLRRYQADETPYARER